LSIPPLNDSTQDEAIATDKSTGQLFVVSAPSGAGKTSLINALIKQMPTIQVSISHTTRPPRPNEVDGNNYFFTTTTNFEALIEANAFLEYAKVFDYYYGTSRAWVENTLQNGIDTLLEIDWQGAEQITALFPNAVSIFILPPSVDILYERLIKRQQDTPPVIDKRLAEAGLEIAHCHTFDYLLVNNVFEDTLADLASIVRSSRLKQARQAQKHKKLLGNLLKNKYTD